MTELFTLDIYAALLKTALDKGVQFDTYDQLKAEGSSSCLLRHDMDISMHSALEMAIVEHQLGVRSTYFLMLRSPCYNLLDRRSAVYVKQILEMGHQIGLHYDQGFDSKLGLDVEKTSQNIQKEKDFLEREFETMIHTVSFHQPSKIILTESIDCGGLVNTYDKKTLSAYEYYSDSNQTFPLYKGSGEFVDSLASQVPQNIQLLVHPEWWVFEGNSTPEIWNRAIQDNLDLMEGQLIETERAYGEKRLHSVVERINNP